jgi:hypothetical protein
VGVWHAPVRSGHRSFAVLSLFLCLAGAAVRAATPFTRLVTGTPDGRQADAASVSASVSGYHRSVGTGPRKAAEPQNGGQTSSAAFYHPRLLSLTV